MEKTQKSQMGLIIGFSVVGAVLTAALGVLMHLSSGVLAGRIGAALSVKGESVWEHLGMLVIPFFILTLIEYAIYGRNYGNFFVTRVCGCLSGIALMLTRYYTLAGIIGRLYLEIELSIFVSAVILTYFISIFFILKKGRSDRPERREIVSVMLFILITATVIFMPYADISLPIFTEQINHKMLFMGFFRLP